MKALVLGASGYVGHRLVDVLGSGSVVGTGNSRSGGDLIHFDASTMRLGDLLASLPQPVTHVFVFYGIVDPNRCARDPSGTAKVNVDSVIRVLGDAQDAGLVPVYISTDYVFDGERSNRTEDEPVCPTTEYGRQKAAVETWLAGTDRPWLVARLSKVVGLERDTHSVLGQWVNDIVEKRPMKSATDQIFSPAWVDDISRALAELAERRVEGIVHVAGPAMSRYHLNRLLVDAVRAVDPSVEAEVATCSLRDIPFAEVRPLDTSLSTARMEALLPWRFRSMESLCQATAERHFGSVDAAAAGE